MYFELNLAVIIRSDTGFQSNRLSAVSLFNNNATPLWWTLSSLPEYSIVSPVAVFNTSESGPSAFTYAQYLNTVFLRFCFNLSCSCNTEHCSHIPASNLYAFCRCSQWRFRCAGSLMVLTYARHTFSVPSHEVVFWESGMSLCCSLDSLNHNN